MSEATGQNTLTFALTNQSSSACNMLGYPGVSLVAADGRVLGFEYQRQGDQMISSRPPSRVTLAPRASAAVAINKYRCDGPNRDTAVTVRLIPPDERSFLALRLPPAMSVAYCGAGDPGSGVEVSPVAATRADTLAH